MASHSSNTKAHNNKQAPKGLAARRTAVTLVTKVLDDHQTLDQLTDASSAIRFYQELETRDQNLAKAIALTTLRHQKRISFILSKVYERKPPQKARILIHALHVGAAQILFMDVPPSAAVNLTIQIIRNDKRAVRFAGFANAVLRNLERRKNELLEKSETIHPFPDWINKKLCSDYGKAKVQQSSAILSQEPHVDLTLKPNTNFSKSESVIPLPLGSVRLIENTPIHELPDYQEGNWWVQDISASLPVKLLGDVTGLKVADLCAAPGGKTMQLASLGAEVVAIDQSEKRLKRLSNNLERTKLEAEIITADILELETEQKYDAIILDAPCTATGTARKHPDVLWNKTSDDIQTLSKLQIALIQKAAEILKQGGTLIYANCSLFKDEGENLISKTSFEGLKLDPIKPEELEGLENCINGQGTVRCLPHLLHSEKLAEANGMDGFFIARFIKQ